MPRQTLIEKNHAEASLISEGDQGYSRDEVTIALGGNLNANTVLGEKSIDGTFAALDPAATDGTQNAVAILLRDVDASTAPKKAAVIARHAQVKNDKLEWPENITAAQRTAAIATLKAAGIIVRG